MRICECEARAGEWRRPKVYTCPYCKAKHGEHEFHRCAGLVYIPLSYGDRNAKGEKIPK